MTAHNRWLFTTGSLALVAVIAVALLWPLVAERLAAPPPVEKLTIAVSDSYIGSGLVYIAAAKGYFTREGLDVTLQPYTSGRDALKAALEERADVGTVGDTPIMFALMRGVPVAVVSTIFTAGGAHGVAARDDRGIAAAADLKGRSVGVTLGTDGHFVLSMMLANQGLSLADVRVIGLKPEEMVEALGSNAAVFLNDSGFLFGFHLAARMPWIQANPVKLQRLLKALLRAERFVAEQPQAAHALIVKATGADPGMLEASSRQTGPKYRFHLKLDQGLLIMLEDLSQWALQNGLTPATALPNFLDAISMDAMLVVKPDAVSIVR